MYNTFKEYNKNSNSIQMFPQNKVNRENVKFFRMKKRLKEVLIKLPLSILKSIRKRFMYSVVSSVLVQV